MSKRGLCIVMLLILLLALGTCTSSTLKPFNLTEKDNGKRVELKTGDELAVILPGNPSTGYGWEITPKVFGGEPLVIHGFGQ